MAEKIGEFYYEITADNKILLKEISNTEKKIEGVGKSLTSTFGRMGGAIAGLFSIAAFKSWIQAATESAKQTLILDNNLKQVGSSFAKMKTTIDALAKANAVDDDDIKNVMNYGIALGVPVQRLNDFVQASYDYAASTGKELTMAMRMVSTAAIKGGESFEQFRKRFSGARAELVKANPFQVLKVQMDDLGESMGRMVLPAVNKVIEFLVKLFDLMEKNAGLRNFAVTLGVVTAAVFGLVGALGAVGVSLTALNASLGVIGLIVVGVSTTIGLIEEANKKAAEARGFTYNEKGQITAVTNIQNARNSIKEVKSYLAELKRLGDEREALAKRYEKQEIDFFAFSDKDEELKKKVREYMNKIDPALREDIEKRGIDVISKDISKLVNKAESLGKQTGQSFGTGFEEGLTSEQILQNYQDSLQGITKSMMEIIPLQTEQGAQFQKIATSVGGLFDNIQAYQKAIKDAEAAQVQLNVTTADIVSIASLVYNVFSGIADAIQNITRNNSVLKSQTQEILDIIEQYKRAVDAINIQIGRAAFGVSSEELKKNLTVEAIEAEIKAKETLVDTNKKLLSENESFIGTIDRSRLDALNNTRDYFTKLLRYFETEAENQKFLGFETGNSKLMKKNAEDTKEYLKNIEAQIALINASYQAETDNYGILLENEKLQNDILELKKQALTVENQTRLEQETLIQELAESEKVQDVEKIIDAIRNQIEALEGLLEVTDDINERMTLQIQINNKLKEIEDKKLQTETKITSELNKQYNLMLKAKGLDVENIRDIQTILGQLKASGLSDVGILQSATDLGIKQRGNIKTINGNITTNIYNPTGNKLDKQITTIMGGAF